jgi:hypothetical protein
MDSAAWLCHAAAIPSLYQRKEDHHEHIENTHSADSSPGHELVKKFGWYGMAFFFIKGALWLIIPFIMYAVN